MSEESQQMSEKYLKELGVQFMSDEFVTDYDGDKVYMKSGKTIRKWIKIFPDNDLVFFQYFI